MLKRYTFWLWAAAVFQFLTAFIHALGMFLQPEPTDETQQQLMHLMQTYRLEAGAGFRPSMADLVTALSSCFSFVCLLGGSINVYLLKKRADREIVRGVTLINVIVFGAIFAVMAFLTFLPPIICSGLIFTCLLPAYFLNRKAAS